MTLKLTRKLRKALELVRDSEPLVHDWNDFSEGTKNSLIMMGYIEATEHGSILMITKAGLDALSSGT